MNKGELVKAIAEDAGLTNADATNCLNSLLSTVAKALEKGDTVSLVGFGSFQAKKRDARQGRNPQTGAAIQIPAANVPSFKAGKALKDAVN